MPKPLAPATSATRTGLLLRSKDETGAPVTRTGKYATVWRREPGGPWRVIADIGSYDRPAAPDTGTPATPAGPVE